MVIALRFPMMSQPLRSLSGAYRYRFRELQTMMTHTIEDLIMAVAEAQERADRNLGERIATELQRDGHASCPSCRDIHPEYSRPEMRYSEPGRCLRIFARLSENRARDKIRDYLEALSARTRSHIAVEFVVVVAAPGETPRLEVIAVGATNPEQ